MNLFRLYNTIIFVFFIQISFGQYRASNLSSENIKKENEYYNAIEKYKSEGNPNYIGAYYNKLGYLYWDTENPELAIECFSQSIAYNTNIGNNNALKTLYTNLGMINSDLGNYETSLLNFRKSLKIAEFVGNKQDISSGLLNISLILGVISRNEEAIINLERALEIAKEIGNMNLLRSCYGSLYENYKSMGDNEKSYEYFDLYSSFDKQIQKEEIKKKDVENKQKVDAITKQKEIVEKEKTATEKVLQETEDSLIVAEELNRQKQMELELQDLTLKEQQAQLKVQKTLIFSVVIVALLLGLVAFVIFRSYNLKKIANLKLEKAFQRINKQNEDIKKSINYAQRIQGAMLPHPDSIKLFILDSFIFFSPRDIVSGDFYFLSETNPKLGSSIIKKNINQDNGNLRKINDFIIGAIDCTGHGVPGAFMSMIGYNMLTEILNKGITEVDQILNELHLGIQSSLKQKETHNKDGMDMALCRVKLSTNEVEYSGARNPFVYIQDNELFQIKADRVGIGGAQNEEERLFTKHSLKINKPTTCYIFSDGFPDQFGGPEGDKYMIKLFKDLLLNIHQEPMDKQKKILEETLHTWMGSKYSQLDDILVVGFRITPG